MTERLNPDFRGADEVTVPDNLPDMLGWIPDPDEEARRFGRMYDDTPRCADIRDAVEPPPAIWQQWQDFQASKGRYPGSNDMGLLDEFLDKAIYWKPQIIGSCVLSNTFRPWVTRANWQVHILKQVQEKLGPNEYGTKNLAFYAAWSYGMARKRGNMKGGDGLYCSLAVETLTRDGVIPCDSPELLSLTSRLGVTADTDYPEPQGNDGARIYRRFGDWAYLDELKPAAKYALREAPMIKSVDQLWDWLVSGKTAFVCSNEAIRKAGTHPDGFAYHERDPRNSWAHNMYFDCAHVASDGERFIGEGNESWGSNNYYRRRWAELDKAFRSGRLTCAGIGEIDLPQSEAPAV